MCAFNHNVKKVLANALENKNETMFVVDGKLISLEVHDTASEKEGFDALAQEIEAYPELKESLQRYHDNPNMERYTAKELKELRYGQRK